MPLMGIPSISELIIISGVIFLLFGAKKLPELGGAVGESIKNFKKDMGGIIECGMAAMCATPRASCDYRVAILNY